MFFKNKEFVRNGNRLESCCMHSSTHNKDYSSLKKEGLASIKNAQAPIGCTVLYNQFYVKNRYLLYTHGATRLALFDQGMCVLLYQFPRLGQQIAYSLRISIDMSFSRHRETLSTSTSVVRWQINEILSLFSFM